MNDIVRAEIVDVCPSPYGYAVFLRADKKVFIIYMDRTRGTALQAALDGYHAERPLTHEFLVHLLDGMDCTVKSVLIYHVDDGTFFTRITVEMVNELGRKIIEVDGRPSDTFAIAARAGAPIFISERILSTLEDMSEALKKLKGV